MGEELRGRRFELRLGEPGYPEILENIAHPPQTLYGIGDPAALKPGVAIIGSRKATPYGLTCTERFAAYAGRKGLTIIAGGARGCDLSAHKAALEVGAPTVVVFGSSPDIVYPKSGRVVFQEAIDRGGAVISEHVWGTAPLPAFFPQRNRIIAGLSIMLLIAEAGLPSGTFSTADAALSQGKEVGVIPGAITSPNAKGSNHLLCQGATPIIDYETFDDCLEQAFVRHPVAFCQDAGSAEEGTFERLVEKDDILRALSADAYRPEELAAYFGFSCAELARRLSQYEIQGLVERGRDGRYQLKAYMRK